MKRLDVDPDQGRLASVQPPIGEGQARADQSAFDEANWTAFCEQLHQEALQGSGMSYDVFTGRYSEGIDRALESVPARRRLRALRIAKVSGDYSTPEQREETRRWNAANGYCSHGITMGCCPAGCYFPADGEGDASDDVSPVLDGFLVDNGVDTHAMNADPSAPLALHADRPPEGGSSRSQSERSAVPPLAAQECAPPPAQGSSREGLLRVAKIVLALLAAVWAASLWLGS